jgi:hypothetical protein
MTSLAMVLVAPDSESLSAYQSSAIANRAVVINTYHLTVQSTQYDLDYLFHRNPKLIRVNRQVNCSSFAISL